MVYDVFLGFAAVSTVAALSLAGYAVWAARKKEWSIERLYPVCAAVFGAVYLFLIPLSCVPDEPLHIDAAYHYSNVMLRTVGEREAEGLVVKRVCDTNWMNHTQKVTREDYVKCIGGLAEKNPDVSLTVEPSTPAVFHVSYLISGAGIALGRLLHFNAAWTFLLGRLFLMALFIAAMRYAIKKIPIGKTMLFVVALMPMTLQQTSSYSYDSVTLGCAFFVTAMAFSFAFGKGAAQIKDVIFYILASVLLVCSKGGVYSLLVFLPFLLLLGKKKPTKKTVLLFIAAVSAVCLLAGRTVIADRLTGNAQAITQTAQTEMEQQQPQPETDVPQGAYVAWADDYAYSLGEMIKHPSIVAHHYVDTFLSMGRYYLETMVGSELASLNIPVSFVFIYLFLAMALFGALEGSDRAVHLTFISRAGIWMAVLITSAASMMAMFLYWTPKDSPVILGVQGRYFLPLLPMFLLSFQNRRLRIWKNLDKIVSCITIFLNVGVMIQVLSYSW